MPDIDSLLRTLAEQFSDVIGEVDRSIGENKNYGEGIGPHDEDDQIAALVNAIQEGDTYPGSLFPVKNQPSKTRYPGGKSADLVIEADEATVFCEAKLFRFQRANGDPSPEAYSKVFNPYQDHSPRSFIHDVAKLAESEVATQRGFVGIYYRPVSGAGTEITGDKIAEKFASDVEKWTCHPISVVSVVPFDGLQHDVHRRGSILTWKLNEQPRQWFSENES